jgi:hypothetical protein
MMLGFLFGTACLVGLVWVWKGGRWHSHQGCGRSRGWLPLRWLFERLDTSPGQEKVIRFEVEELLNKFGDFERTLRESKTDVAKAFRADDFNAEVMGDVFSRQDGAIDELRRGLVGALAKVHDALDSRQRARLADLLESMPGRGWGRGPYRSRA